eukprot:CAMPEP_0194365304 /NCGR_PEP_ID=MMETSP0174-20130528/13315_1 /TAXON_ID=216777 /ORGANISM="Proboscia alata, Strain PI-D3" /LENGTH=166 /DNA_ID=CAMNT_0039139883 /DNA_START=45 /DNA_END=541 /DNA_ORIENTATION=+
MNATGTPMIAPHHQYQHQQHVHHQHAMTSAGNVAASHLHPQHAHHHPNHHQQAQLPPTILEESHPRSNHQHNPSHPGLVTSHHHPPVIHNRMVSDFRILQSLVQQCAFNPNTSGHGHIRQLDDGSVLSRYEAVLALGLAIVEKKRRYFEVFCAVAHQVSATATVTA